MRSAIGEKNVVEAEGFAIFYCVAIAFVLIFVVEGLGVGEANLGAFATGDGELGVCSRKGFAIEQQMKMASGGNRSRGGWESF